MAVVFVGQAMGFEPAIRNNETAVGAQGRGGGIYTEVGGEILRVQVQGNRAGNGGGMQIASQRPASISASAFIENDAHTGGALSVQTTELTITQSTFSGNVACLRAAAIAVIAGDIAITSTTIVFNRVEFAISSLCTTDLQDGAGILVFGDDPVALTNTILAANTVALSPSDCAGELLSGGFNLIGTDEGCDFDEAASDVVGGAGAEIDPGLGPLTSVGSPTSYHLPGANSPALEEGAACGAVDQRGQTRPADGDGNGSVVCDIGSVER